MRTCLVGHTGFVGGNLLRAHAFDATYNSSTIHDMHGQAFDLVVCAAPQAKKWWSNLHPDEDAAMIRALADSLGKVEAARVVLISTIDVFPVLVGVDESFDCGAHDNHPYGRNRLALEAFVRQRFPRCSIVRLPALFGSGLKKNALFDLMHDNQPDKIDPESWFQWYDVGRLWRDIERTIEAGIELVVMATEPVRTGDIHRRFFPQRTIGNPSATPVRYDVRTRHAQVYGGRDGYVMDGREVMSGISRYLGRPA